MGKTKHKQLDETQVIQRHEGVAPPTVNNDSADTAGIGVKFRDSDIWVYNNIVYTLKDSTPTTAVWLAYPVIKTFSLISITTTTITHNFDFIGVNVWAISSTGLYVQPNVYNSLVNSVDIQFSEAFTGTIFVMGDGASALSGGGLDPYKDFDFPAGSWDYPQTNFAEFYTLVGTNQNLRGNVFDDTTEEFIEAQIKTPDGLDLSGTVEIEVMGLAITPVASKNIQLKLYHKISNDVWDGVYSSKVSGDLAVSSVAKTLDRFTWNETVSNLGWVANKQVQLKISRIASSIDNLVDDYLITYIRIRVPKA